MLVPKKISQLTIQKADGKIACGTFIDLEKASDTANHDIQFEKLDHYVIRGI